MEAKQSPPEVPDPITFLESLSAEQVLGQMQRRQNEIDALRVLLRAARARERAGLQLPSLANAVKVTL